MPFKHQILKVLGLEARAWGCRAGLWENSLYVLLKGVVGLVSVNGDRAPTVKYLARL